MPGEGGGAHECRQALWWRHPTYIMLQQSAQASCFPIGEQRVSRHQKIIIIGQAITTGATGIHCLSTNLAGCRRGEGTACFPSQWSLCLLSSLSDSLACSIYRLNQPLASTSTGPPGHKRTTRLHGYDYISRAFLSETGTQNCYLGLKGRQLCLPDIRNCTR